MIPRELATLLQDERVRRDVTREVRREMTRSKRRQELVLELPFELTDAEVRRRLRTS